MFIREFSSEERVSREFRSRRARLPEIRFRRPVSPENSAPKVAAPENFGSKGRFFREFNPRGHGSEGRVSRKFSSKGPAPRNSIPKGASPGNSGDGFAPRGFGPESGVASLRNGLPGSVRTPANRMLQIRVSRPKAGYPFVGQNRNISSVRGSLREAYTLHARSGYAACRASISETCSARG